MNIVAPYRLPIYLALGREFQTTVFVSGEEHDRIEWRGVESRLLLEGIGVERSWGISTTAAESRGGRVVRFRHLHITPGLLWDLWRNCPDAVITNEMGFRTFVALLYGTLWRKPVWVWWGGTTCTERSISLPRRIARWVIARWARRWISYGETSTEYLLTLGIPRDRVLETQNCVDESQFCIPSEPLWQLEPRPVLLCVGRLVQAKGVHLLIEAAARLRAEGCSFTLLIVGDGPERDSLQAFARSSGLDNVHFRAAQPPDLMPAVYRSADALVFPTLGDVWGLVVNEALWSGLPVIGSVYAGCARELVEEENRFDPLDPDDFDRALRRALEGKLTPPGQGRLRNSADVAGMIVGAIREGVYGKQTPANPGDRARAFPRRRLPAR